MNIFGLPWIFHDFKGLIVDNDSQTLYLLLCNYKSAPMSSSFLVKRESEEVEMLNHFVNVLMINQHCYELFHFVYCMTCNMKNDEELNTV